MSRSSYGSKPLQLNYNRDQLTSAQRKRLAQVSRMYYQKHGTTLPVQLRTRTYGNRTNGQMKATELKGVDSIINQNPLSTDLSSNAGFYTVNLIQPGTGSWNRVGRKIRMKSLRIKCIMNFNSLSNPALFNNNARMVVVYDKQPSGALPIFSTIFGGTDQNGTESSGILFNLAYDNTERFSVLSDEVYSGDIKVIKDTEATQYTINIDKFIKLKGLTTVYSGQSNPCTIADISSGALYIILRAEIGDGSDSVDVEKSICRLRYYDN